jgi:Ca2+-binding EF-hand superfamily protein
MLRYQCATSDLLPTTYAWAQAAGGGRGRDEAFLARARRVFDSYDAEGAGRLSRQETKLAWLALLGCKPSRCELADLLAPEPAAQRGGGEEDEGADGMGERRVVWARFAEAAVRRRAGIDGSDEVRQAFKAFDRRCAGFLTLADVKAVFREVAAHVNERTGETGSCTTRMQGPAFAAAATVRDARAPP